MNKLLLISKALRTIGIILFCFGGYLIFEQSKMRKEMIPNIAEIREYHPVDAYPLLHFYTQEGEGMSIFYQHKLNQSKYAVGSEIPIYYWANKPYDIVLDSPFERWKGSVISTSGLLLFLGGIFLARREKLKKK